MTELKKVCIIGSGNFATIMAKIIAKNIMKLEKFSDEVSLYVPEEIIDGKQLTDIINESHENIKYAAGFILPDNVIAISDIIEAAKEADILVFSIEQKHLSSICTTLAGKIKPTAAGLSLIRGFNNTDDGSTIDLFSHFITRHLKIQTSVMMGSNICNEIGSELFCEVTLGCKDKLLAATLKDLIETDYLCVTVTDDVDAVEVCGSLRDVIGCAVGFLDGLEKGRSAKATAIRLGLIEMITFVDLFFPGSKVSTFFESCGVADLATTFLSGRHRQLSEKFIASQTSVKDLEDQMFSGYRLAGPLTAEKINYMLKDRGWEEKFPLLSAVHKVYEGELDPQHFLDTIYNNSEHINVRLQHLTW